MMTSFARRSSRTFLLAFCILGALAVFSLTRRRHGMTEVVKFQRESNARQVLPDAGSNGAKEVARPGDEAPEKMTTFSCRPYGWEYAIVIPNDDERSPMWKQEAIAATKMKGIRNGVTSLCGYGAQGLPRGTSGGILIDIGAHYGLSMLPYASRGWQVFAFEPLRSNVAVLRANIRLNSLKSVHVVHAAASRQRGSSVIHVPKGRTDNSALGGDKVALANVGGKEVTKETIRLAKVDDELFGLGPFDVKKVSKIKIDTQGHEVEVLKGMHKLLAEIPSSTLVEVEYDPKMQVRAGYEESTLLDQARSLGFDVHCGTVCYPKEGSQPSCPNITLRRASPSKAGLCKKSDESKKTDVGAGQGSDKDGMTSMAGENAAPASNGDKVQSVLA